MVIGAIEISEKKQIFDMCISMFRQIDDFWHRYKFLHCGESLPARNRRSIDFLL